jgi:hypothetical protein
MSRPRRRATRFLCTAAVAGLAACGKDAVSPGERAEPLAIAPPVARAFVAAPQPMATLYGPRRFVRSRGPVDLFAVDISTLRFEAPFTLHVRNGASDGSERVFGGSVVLDGRTMLSQQDFARQTVWAFPVPLGTSAALQVSLAGPPGGYLEIWIEGKRSLPVFCPGGPPGSYATLREAIDDVWLDGTVLVCDGEHPLDRVVINKPLTLRSQNSGRATISDEMGGGGFSAGAPALIVDGIATGLVRIADLNFLVQNVGMSAAGTYDQLQLDSVTMQGRRLLVTVGLRPSTSSSPTRRVDVTRSHFRGLHLGVWPIAAVETNVRWSTFDGLSGGSVVYSGTTVAGAASASYGVTEHNTFTNCSTFGCVRVVGPGSDAGEIVIARNTMTPSNLLQDFAVLVSRPPLAGAPPAARVVVEDNDVVGRAPSGGHFLPQSWGIRTFVTALGGPNASPLLIRNNRATNVFTFITAGVPVTAHDNVMTGGFFAVTQQNPFVRVEFLRNDVQFTSSLNRDPSFPLRTS